MTGLTPAQQTLYERLSVADRDHLTEALAMLETGIAAATAGEVVDERLLTDRQRDLVVCPDWQDTILAPIMDFEATYPADVDDMTVLAASHTVVSALVAVPAR